MSLEIKIEEIENGWLLIVNNFLGYKENIGPLFFGSFKKAVNYLEEKVLSEGQLIDNQKDTKKK